VTCPAGWKPATAQSGITGDNSPACRETPVRDVLNHNTARGTSQTFASDQDSGRLTSVIDINEGEKSPTAATIEIAAIASTPGIVISRLTIGSASTWTAGFLSTTASSAPWQSNWRSSAAPLDRSSAGST
jgi:hypothetical protein